MLTGPLMAVLRHAVQPHGSAKCNPQPTLVEEGRAREPPLHTAICTLLKALPGALLRTGAPLLLGRG